jgi:hypothetical protein
MALVLSLVALDGTRLPPDDELSRILSAESPGTEGPHQFRRRGDILTFEFTGHDVALALMAAAIPEQDLEGPIAASSLWPEASVELRRQRAHLVVTVFAKKADPIKLWMTMTRVVAALAAVPSVIGIFWVVAGLVHSATRFRALARNMSREHLPLFLWIGFRVGQNPDGSLYGFTTGLQALDHMELEVSQCNWTADELVDRLFNFAHYLIDRGPVLLDGETIGISADEQIAIEHRLSLCGDGRMVIHLQP